MEANGILAYLEWRGDLTFSKSPFNEVDNLILSMLCYLSFEDIVPGVGKRPVSLVKAAEKYFSAHPVPDPPQKAEHSGESYDWMLYRMANTDRYRTITLSDYVSITDERESEHFAALCIHLDRKSIYIAFRGTADKLIGWKEDFLLACLPEIPSQKQALEYLIQAAEQYPDVILQAGGHSKGGNLAVYAAAKAPLPVQERIRYIWANDSPGFQEKFLRSRGYKRISDRIRSIVPESSVVGMLLAHEDRYEIVGSSQIGLMQHDGFSWEVSGAHFVQKEGLSGQSMLVDLKIRDYLEGIPPKQRKKTVDALFELLRASGATTLTEVRKGKLKVAFMALPQIVELPKEIRDSILEFLVLVEQISLRLSVESRWNKTMHADRE